MAELSVLVKQEPGEKLFVYLSTTEYAVSSVPIKEEGSDQKPIYYVSHALRGPELCYSEVEKIAMALVMTARKLRLYFMPHQIMVLTYSHLGRIMTHSEVSGRMIKWTVELGEYYIEYRPRVAIKAQALSIFLSEMVQPDEEEINGIYEAKDDKILKYLKLIQAQEEVFVDWSIEQIPRNENREEDALAKMAASLSEISTREVLHVSHLILSTEEETMPAPEDSWRTPLIKFIVSNELPEDKARAQKINRQALMRLISDNGTQFQGKEITAWCQELKIAQSFTSVAYPQANGQTEVVNRIIVQALKTRLQGNGKDWQSSAGIESYPVDNDQSRAMELDLVEEKREQTLILIEAYRGQVMKSYTKRVRIRDVQIGDLVMKKVNPHKDVGKLEARWEGTFKITRKVSS
ncbi:uncharacterized protein LOC142528317 [Primulina tabacum]|uniref:uncharacterized protein LOC142528317 n=1 Tax=Primulina tabacum TaxID=48773 RepID=UPI003F5A3FD6